MAVETLGILVQYKLVKWFPWGGLVGDKKSGTGGDLIDP